MRARSFLLAMAVAGCGGSTLHASKPTTPSQTTASDRSPRSTALDLDCENSFAPGTRFLGGKDWRRKAVRVGAITIIRGTRLGGGKTAPGTFVAKLPVLLRPEVRASLDIDVDRSGGFFVARGGGLVTAPPSQGRRRAYVGPCPRIPREAQPETPETGMGIFITTTRPACATLTVRWAGHVRSARLRLGVKRCGSRA